MPRVFTHALKLAGFNAPLYAVAALGMAGGSAVAALAPMNEVRIAGALLALGAGWFGAVSFLAFHAMFDRSGFLDWTWLQQELSPPPKRWLHVSAGLELTDAPMSTLFQNAEGVSLDIYDPVTMPAPAVGRAHEKAGATAKQARPDALPVADGWADAIVVTLAAHEIRDDTQRARFFDEVKRVLAPAGRLVLIEHLRDAASLLAFGPGFLHFLPRREWLEQTARIGLEVERERGFSPFIRVFTCAR